MMADMKRRLISIYCVLIGILAMPGMLLAASSDDEKHIDARLVNYAKPVAVEEASTTLLWLLMIFLAIVCVGAMFKQAKRTHLD